MDHHSCSLKIKSVAADGSFVGLGAAYSTDLGGDRILPGAFQRTLSGSKTLPLLWQHQADSPIGSVRCTETSQGLQVEGQLELADPTAAKAYRFLKAGIIKGLSIGFETIKSSFVDEIRELSEIKLWEVSVVTFPMNQEAVVTGVKQMSDDDRSKHLRAIDTHRRAIDRHGRQIREHLKAMTDDLLDDDDPESDLADPTLLEDEDDGEMSMILAELKSLAAAAEELATA